MFEGLNAIPWVDLTHAYGSAEEVPMWLRQLTSSDANIRTSATNDLCGSICHQGWICPATAYAVPYLLELLQEPHVEGKEEILELLEDIAVAEDLKEERWRENTKVPSWNVPAHIPFKDARQEVGNGTPIYLTLLEESSDPYVQVRAANLLREFATLTPELQARLDGVEQPEPLPYRPSHGYFDTFRIHLRDLFLKEFSQIYPTKRVSRRGGGISAGDLLEVNQKIVFRIPDSPSAIASLKREYELLCLLRERLSTPIPNPRYVNMENDEPGRVFMGYPILPGKPLHKEMLESIDGEETIEALAVQIASFLHNLHHISLAELTTIALPVIHERKKYEILYERVRRNLLPYLQPDTCEEIAASFETFLDTPQNFILSPVLIHGNFGPHRILYNAKTRSISGITGFTRIGLGDPASDFATLLGPRGYDKRFVERFERIYPDFQALRQRIQFYVNASIVQDALTRLEQQQLENIARKLTFYRI